MKERRAADVIIIVLFYCRAWLYLMGDILNLDSRRPKK